MLGHADVISADYSVTCQIFKEDTFERQELLCLSAELQALTQRDDTAARLPGASARKKSGRDKCAEDADVEAAIIDDPLAEGRYAELPQPSSISNCVAAKQCAY